MVNTPQTCPEDVIKRLCSLYPDGTVESKERITEGLSGATVLLVYVKAADDRVNNAYDGLAFAKIDREKRSQEELRRHRLALTKATTAFIPGILGDPIGPVKGWSMALYQPAQETLLRARSLGQLIKEEQPSDQVALQIRHLFTAFSRSWHEPAALRRSERLHAIPDLVRMMANRGGIQRTKGLPAWLQKLGVPGPEYRTLQFMPGNLILPNPFAYLFDDATWRQRDGTIRTLVAPLVPSHGDLHGSNLICRIDEQDTLDANVTPWLIDFALFEQEQLPFFDLAYLELDLLSRCLPTQSVHDGENWRRMTEHLASTLVPKGHPAGTQTAAAWTVVQPVREHLATLLATRGMNGPLREQYEQAWWLAAATVGALAARRQRVKVESQRTASLLYSARCLSRLLRTNPEDVPCHVWWPSEASRTPHTVKKPTSRRRKLDTPNATAAHTLNHQPVFFVPSNLPPHYVERPEALRQVRMALLNQSGAVGIVGATALHGQGGIGKTVLARAVCDDPTIRSAFPDGVLWATLGQHADPVSQQRNWIQVLGGNETTAINSTLGAVELRRLLLDRAMLLVIDDVWVGADASVLNVGGPRCRTLFTTRDASQVDGVRIVPLSVLSAPESRQLLRGSRGIGPLDLTEKEHLSDEQEDELVDAIAERVGRLPLALDIIGALLGSGVSWQDTKHALDAGGLRRVRHGQLSVLDVIARGAEALPEDDRQRYHELAIFPRARALDTNAVAILWGETAGLKPWETRHLLAELRVRALLQADYTLHDLQLDYLHASVAGAEQQRLHKVFADVYLRAYSADAGASWTDMPVGGTIERVSYPWRWLAWHLQQAGQEKELSILVSDARYLERKIGLLGTEATALDADLLNNEVARDLAGALRLSAYVLDVDPQQLTSQLTGRLGAATPLHHTEKDGLQLYLFSKSLIAPGGPLLRTIMHVPAVEEAFSPDGHVLAIVGTLGEVVLYDTATGAELRRLASEEDLGWTQSLAFSADGHTLAVDFGGVGFGFFGTGGVVLYHAATGEQIHRLITTADLGLAQTLAFSPNGQTIGVVFGIQPLIGARGGVVLYHAATGEQIHHLITTADLGFAQALAFSPNGRTFAISFDGEEEDRVALYDVATGVELRRLAVTGSLSTLAPLAFSPDGRSLVVGTRRGVVVYDAATGVELHRLPGAEDPYGTQSLAFSADGHILAVGVIADTRLYDMNLSDNVHPTDVTVNHWVAVFTSDGRTLAVGNRDGVVVYDAVTGTELHQMAGAEDLGRALVFNPDGLTLAASIRGGIVVYDVATGAELHRLPGAEDPNETQALAFSPDGRLLAVSGSRFESNTDALLSFSSWAFLYDVATGAELHRLLDNEDPRGARALAFSPDGCLLAVSVGDKVTLHDAVTGSELHRITRSTSFEVARTLAFSPDGRILAVGFDVTGGVALYDAATGARMHRLAGAEDPRGARALAFSPDGCLLAVGIGNRVALYDVGSGKQLAVSSIDALLQCLAWSRDGSSMLLFDAGGRIHHMRMEGRQVD